ncbi:MAG TPA: hypothetical protein VLQ80_15575 [Candidatus Saccharimonadia bacterium]|nr:hypothetical protein [Candidatus Saccharimonadia bacterium]
MAHRRHRDAWQRLDTQGVPSPHGWQRGATSPLGSGAPPPSSVATRPAYYAVWARGWAR